jgi:hypothetical protein
MIITRLECSQLSPNVSTAVTLQPSSAFLVCKPRFNNTNVAPFRLHSTSPHLQLKEEALQERSNVPRAPGGGWDDVAIVLTHTPDFPLSTGGRNMEMQGATSAAYGTTRASYN